MPLDKHEKRASHIWRTATKKSEPYETINKRRKRATYQKQQMKRASHINRLADTESEPRAQNSMTKERVTNQDQHDRRASQRDWPA